MLFALGGSIGIAHGAVAHAQQLPVPVAVAIDACLVDGRVRVDASEVRRIASLELRMPLVPIHEATPLTTRLTASCDADGEVIVIRVDDPLTNKSLERRLRLAEHEPRGRARLLALAMVELLVTSWTELASERATQASSELEVPDSMREAAASMAQERLGLSRAQAHGPLLSIGAEVRGRILLLGPWPVLGGGIRVGLWPLPWLAVRASFIAEGSQAFAPGGLVDIQAYGGELALELTAQPHPSFEVGGGLGVSAQHGILQGRTTIDRVVPARVEGLHACLAAFFVGRVVVGRLLTELRLEAGWAIVRLIGTTSGQTIELGGPSVGLSIVAGWRGW